MTPSNESSMEKLPDIGDTYQCYTCGKREQMTCTQADAIAEYEIVFQREAKRENLTAVCRDCWNTLVKEQKVYHENVERHSGMV